MAMGTWMCSWQPFGARRYPEPTSSKLFRNHGGDLQLDEENSRVLQNVGLVSGAVFQHLTGDGFRS